MSHSILSVRQPWASLLVSGVKRFEVRTWVPASPPGWILIHASSGRAAGLAEFREHKAFERALKRADMLDQAAWAQSAIVGAVRIAAFLDTWKVEQQPKRLTEIDDMMIGDSPDRYLWKVAEARRFRTPIRAHGKLKLWTPDTMLARKVDQAIRRDAPDYQPLSARAT
jgi:predicted transcriptional regulator